MLNNYYVSNPPAEQAFNDLLINDRPWILIYHGSIGSGKSILLSWLIENRCMRNRIPYSLMSFDMYSSNIDELFESAADSIVSMSNLPQVQANILIQQLTGVTAHYVPPITMSMVLFFDDYQIFERSTPGELSQFWNRMIRAHRGLPGLRVVIASREYCRLPDAWFYMREASCFKL